MPTLSLHLRTDVLAAMRRHLLGPELLDDVIEDAAYLEATSRKWCAGTDAAPKPLDCTMSQPLEAVNVTIPDGPYRILHDALLPDETVDGLVSALLICEVRLRRTGLHWQIASANEPVMTPEVAAYEHLVRHPNTTISMTGGQLMYSITAEVNSEVLAEYDATLDSWEDRSEELAALIHLEDEKRDAGASTTPRSPADGETMKVIEVRLDAHDYAALERVLGSGDVAGDLLTGLMLDALSDQTQDSTPVSKPLRLSA